MIVSLLKIWIKNKALLTLWIVLTSLLAIILSLSPESPFLSLVSILTKEGSDKIIWVLLLILIGLIISLLIINRKYKEKINIQEFTFIDPPGYYTHPKYSYWICPHCLIDKGRISPVSKVDENAWYCTVCKQPLSGTLGEVFTVEEQF